MVKKLKVSKKIKNKLTNKQSQKQVVNIHIGSKGKKTGGYRRNQPKSEPHYQSGFTPVYIQTGNPNDFTPLVQAVGELGNTIRSQPLVSQPATQPVSVSQPVEGRSFGSQIHPTKEDEFIKDMKELGSQTKEFLKPSKYDKSKNSEFLSKLKNHKFEVENPQLNRPESSHIFRTPAKADKSISADTPFFTPLEKPASPLLRTPAKADKSISADTPFFTPLEKPASPLLRTPAKADKSISADTPFFTPLEKPASPLLRTPAKADAATSPILNPPQSILSPYRRFVSDTRNNGDNLTPVADRIRGGELERRRQQLRDEYLALGGSSFELDGIKNNQTKLKKAIKDLKSSSL